MPFTYTDEERERIQSYVCAQLATGRSLRSIFKEDKDSANLCGRDVFSEWRLKDQGLADRIVRARVEGLEAVLEELPEIADDRKEDPDASSRKVRIYARERMAAMLAPAAYGAKVDVTSGGEKLPAPAPVLVDNRIQSVLMLVQRRKQDEEELKRLLD